VLLDRESPSLQGPAARFVVGMAQRLPAVIAAYRTGAGVDWAEYGPDVVEAQEALNRPQFQHFVGDWIHDLPDIADRLRAGGRIADLGCGTGWSSIWMARHFPEAHVDGIDIDADSIERANDNAEREGMTDRVSFRLADGASADGAGRYDLVTLFEALHDMANPVEVLGAARSLLAPGGAVLVGDERADETFSAPVDSTDRMFYGYSVLACLPNGRVGETSVATGTVMRPSTVERYARDAGFDGFTILPTDHGQFRFYRLDR
jgi:ubiquinone/menaquinone biosynthesis C-methylase UbiE